MVINCSIPSSCLVQGRLVRKPTSSLRYRLELRTLAEDNLNLFKTGVTLILIVILSSASLVFGFNCFSSAHTFYIVHQFWLLYLKCLLTLNGFHTVFFAHRKTLLCLSQESANQTYLQFTISSINLIAVSRRLHY